MTDLKNMSLDTAVIKRLEMLQCSDDDYVSNSPLTGTEDDWTIFAEAREKALLPLKEDVAEWLNCLFPELEVSVSNFMEVLDNGIYLCRLANRLQPYIALPSTNGEISSHTDMMQRHFRISPFCKIFVSQFLQTLQSEVDKPTKAVRCNPRARSGSWFARDNTSVFLAWCRQRGVRDECLFETEGLVSHSSVRSVVLCLLELARMAGQHGFTPLPSLIRLEQEIASEEGGSCDEVDETPQRNISAFERRLQASAVHASTVTDQRWFACRRRGSTGSSAESGNSSTSATTTDSPRASEHESSPSLSLSSGSATSLHSTDSSPGGENGVTVAPDSRRAGAAQGRGQALRNATPRGVKRVGASTPVSAVARNGVPGNKQRSHAVVDKQVNEIAAKCTCSQCSVEKVSSGKYKIAGKTVFIRLLNDRHLMVRVGGGWDTLSNYLLRHDPCQLQAMMRDGGCIEGGPQGTPGAVLEAARGVGMRSGTPRSQRRHGSLPVSSTAAGLQASGVTSSKQGTPLGFLVAVGPVKYRGKKS